MRVTVLVLLVSVLSRPAFGASVTLSPQKDNTLYQHPMGSLSNGQGEYLFAGRISFGADTLRRAVLAFDIAGSVPAGSTITGAVLTLNVSLSAPGSGPRAGSLHRLLADWGEGASNAGEPGGMGIQAEPGDATWLHRFYDSVSWSSPGGDFAATPSATTLVDTAGKYSWSGAGMVVDVQAWLDDPATSFGWILVGDEATTQTAKRYDSGENVVPERRPTLEITYDPPIVGSSGAVPGGGVRINRSGPGIAITWGPSCLPGDTDYMVYEGTLRNFTSHLPVLCTTGGSTSATLTLSPGSTYYLVVPGNGIVEGSYGVDSSNAQRPVSALACRPQSLGSCSGAARP